MKVQKIYRDKLQKYFGDEIKLIATADMKQERDGRILLKDIYIPPQNGFEYTLVRHLWVDKKLFKKEFHKKELYIVGEVYSYMKKWNFYSYSISVKRIELIRKGEKWKNC